MFLGSDQRIEDKGIKKTPTHRQLLRQTLERFAEWAALGSKVAEKSVPRTSSIEKNQQLRETSNSSEAVLPNCDAPPARAS
jgi:hypothetical protein